MNVIISVWVVLDYATGLGLCNIMKVSVAVNIHKIEHGGKPLPNFHPPFHRSPYTPFVYNK